MTDTIPLVTLDEIDAAQQAIRHDVHRTPVMGSSYVGNVADARVVLKLELFQKTGSFKVRGVMNTLRQLDEATRASGVISLSAGNHAQALAWSAARYGIPATIVMPSTAMASKVAATRGYGGTVVQTDGDLLATALELQRAQGSTLVHPFDDPRMIAGHASVGLEILDDVPDVDVVVVTCGGGGLISGVASAIKHLRPSVRVIGVEPEGAAAMTQSLQAGSPQRLSTLDTIADGLAAPFAGTVTMAHSARFVDEWILVTDTEIAQAMRVLLERCKLVAEPAAAAAIVPLMSGALRLPSGSTVVPVICGGNIDAERLGSLLARF